MITVKSAKFYECKVRYEKTLEDGYQKKVTEAYVVDALSFTEAEKRVIEEMSAYINGEIEVTAIKIAPYKEVAFPGKAEHDKFYHVRCDFIVFDEKTNKEKKTAIDYLVQAASVEGARRILDDILKETMIDYVIVSLGETNIEDVFIYN